MWSEEWGDGYTGWHIRGSISDIMPSNSDSNTGSESSRSTTKGGSSRETSSVPQEPGITHYSINTTIITSDAAYPILEIKKQEILDEYKRLLTLLEQQNHSQQELEMIIKQFDELEEEAKKMLKEYHDAGWGSYKRDPNNLYEIALNEFNNPAHDPKGDLTYCNQFAAEILYKYTGSKELMGKRVVDQHKYITSSMGWYKVRLKKRRS